VLVLFYLGELARRWRLPIGFISKRHERVVLQVITQEADEDQAALAVSSVLQVHKTDQYLPPLPGGLLNLLGLARQRRTSYVNAAALRRHHKAQPSLGHRETADVDDRVPPVVRSNSDRAIARPPRNEQVRGPSRITRAQSADQVARGVQLTRCSEQSAAPADSV